MQREMAHLCQICKDITFEDIHGFASCKNLDCQLGDWVSMTGVIFLCHSSHYHHYKTFDDLKRSAKDGCHLCTIFSSGLERQRRLRHRNLIGAITVTYATLPPLWYGTDAWEGIRVHCASFSVSFCVADLDTVERGNLTPDIFGTGETGSISLNPASPCVIQQAKKWLSECASGHSKCRLAEVAPLPLRVLDVGPPSGSQEPSLIIMNEERGKYITLSYRWASGGTLTTTSANLARHLELIPMKSLPQSIQDAIKIARLLDVRYLWVDALCILQDSASDWRSQAAQMHNIYARAWLSISADRAVDGDSGFLSKRNPLELRNCIHPMLTFHIRWYCEHCTFGNSMEQRYCEACGTQTRCNMDRWASEDEKTKTTAKTLLYEPAKKGKVIRPSVPSAGSSLADGILSTRGWIVQEQALSRRILEFGQYEVSWTCNEKWASERMPDKITGSWDGMTTTEYEEVCWKHGNWPQIRNTLQNKRTREDRERAYLHPERDMTALFDKCLSFFGVNLMKGAVDTNSYSVWRELVELYSARKLTNPSDKLPAFSGLASYFNARLSTPSEYIAGIWQKDLPGALAWRRAPYHPDLANGDFSPYSQIPSTNYRAPSFSWASVDGPLTYRYSSRADFTLPFYKARVVDYAISLASSDPYSAVTGGWIKLTSLGRAYSGYLTEQPAAENQREFGAKRSLTMDHADEHHWNRSPGLLCVCIRVFNLFFIRQNILQCVVLRPISNSNEYRRIGFFQEIAEEISITTLRENGWADMTIKII